MGNEWRVAVLTVWSWCVVFETSRESHDDDDDDEFCIYIPLHVTKAKTRWREHSSR